MIPVTSRNTQKLALFGLGGSGLATAQALVAGGAEVVCWDDNPEAIKQAQNNNLPVGDLAAVDFTSIDALVLAPGVPLTHPQPHWSVRLAHEAGVSVVGDVGLFSEERQHQASDSAFIAITGTNGKSTTTALIAHVLSKAGRDMQMGGNIGKPVLSLAGFDQKRDYVVECSSYQIDLAPKLNPSIGVLLNLAPDHLDRHGTMERYAAIKARLVEASAKAVIGVDDAYCEKIAFGLREAGHSVCLISVHGPVENGVWIEGTDLMSNLDGETQNTVSLSGIETLRGQHNAQNAAAAYAVCHYAGLSDVEIQNGFKTFPGLAHRMEIVGNLDKTVFVNDSKGTNADAAAMALSSFENIFWIAGGLAKDGGIESLREYFPRIKKAFLIGEAASSFAASLGGSVSYEISGTMEKAVLGATKAARELGQSSVVLLSPACASFDQFRNFEIRGEAFKEEVFKMPGVQAYGEDA